MEEAGRILDEAGWVMGSNGVRERDGQPLKVNVLSTQLERALSYGLMNQFIQQQLDDLGFETEIQTQEWGAYLDEFRAGTWWEVTFHAQNAQSRDTVGAALDPDAYWNVNQHAKVTEGPLVEVAEQLRDIYQRMNSNPDSEQRVEIWKEAQTLAAEHMLVAWLVHWDMLVGYQSHVRDLTIKPVMADTLHHIHLTWIEE
jgi:ABC-type transport system substrate-binding protein